LDKHPNNKREKARKLVVKNRIEELLREAAPKGDTLTGQAAAKMNQEFIEHLKSNPGLRDALVGFAKGNLISSALEFLPGQIARLVELGFDAEQAKNMVADWYQEIARITRTAQTVSVDIKVERIKGEPDEKK